MNRRVGLLAGLLLVVGAGALRWLAIERSADQAPGASDSPTAQGDVTDRTHGLEGTPAQGTPIEGALLTKNRSDRSGAYFIPEGSSLPLLVAFHGTNASGAGLLQAFRDIAVRRRFAVVAPDCGFIPEAGAYTWYSPVEEGDPSPDSEHVARSIEEVLALAGGRIAPTGWLAVGHSGGGSLAPYVATHDVRFAAFGVLHGGARPNAFGPLHPPPRGWFSTGSGDSIRPPDHVGEQARASMHALGPSMVQNHVFPGGHEILPGEIDGVVQFWFDSASADGRR